MCSGRPSTLAAHKAPDHLLASPRRHARPQRSAVPTRTPHRLAASTSPPPSRRRPRPPARARPLDRLHVATPATTLAWPMPYPLATPPKPLCLRPRPCPARPPPRRCPCPHCRPCPHRRPCARAVPASTASASPPPPVREVEGSGAVEQGQRWGRWRGRWSQGRWRQWGRRGRPGAVAAMAAELRERGRLGVAMGEMGPGEAGGCWGGPEEARGGGGRR